MKKILKMLTFIQNKWITTILLFVAIGLIQGCEDPMNGSSKINILEIASL